MIDLNNKIIPIWKPVSWTSFDVVKKIRSITKIKKVGHAGSLDPFAEGLVIICTGNKTKEVEKIMSLRKEYFGRIELGKTTETLDAESPIEKIKNIKKFDKDSIIKISKYFIGKIKQEPPVFSALKVNGLPLYKYARQNIHIKVKPRLINIYEIDILNVYSESFTFRVLCGRGTYIRSLARDIAKKLGTVGYLSSLKRTKVGKYIKKNAINIEDIRKWNYLEA